MKRISIFLISLFLVSHDLVSSEVKETLNDQPSRKNFSPMIVSDKEWAVIKHKSLAGIALFLDIKAETKKKASRGNPNPCDIQKIQAFNDLKRRIIGQHSYYSTTPSMVFLSF